MSEEQVDFDEEKKPEEELEAKNEEAPGELEQQAELAPPDEMAEGKEAEGEEVAGDSKGGEALQNLMGVTGGEPAHDDLLATQEQLPAEQQAEFTQAVADNVGEEKAQKLEEDTAEVGAAVEEKATEEQKEEEPEQANANPEAEAKEANAEEKPPEEKAEEQTEAKEEAEAEVGAEVSDEKKDAIAEEVVGPAVPEVAEEAKGENDQAAEAPAAEPEAEDKKEEIAETLNEGAEAKEEEASETPASEQTETPAADTQANQEAAAEQQQEAVQANPEELVEEGSPAGEAEEKEAETEELTDAVGAQAEAATEADVEKAPDQASALSKLLEQAAAAMAAAEEIAGTVKVESTPEQLMGDTQAAVDEYLANIETYTTDLATIEQALTAAIGQVGTAEGSNEAAATAQTTHDDVVATMESLRGKGPQGAEITVAGNSGVAMSLDVNFQNTNSAAQDAMDAYLVALEALRAEGADVQSEEVMANDDGDENNT